MSTQRLQRPGFGIPVDEVAPWEHWVRGARFPHAILDDFAIPGLTQREKSMLDFVNQISDKPRWWEKVHDERIVERWRSEAGGGSEERQRYEADCLDRACFDFCIAELRDKAAFYQNRGVILVLDIMASVVKSDSDPPDGFWNALRSAVEPLEKVPDHLKDWHPGSNRQVLDLVHPSICPLEYGKSRVLPHDTVPKDECMAYTGLGEQCPPLPSDFIERAAKYTDPETKLRLQPYGNYQWLPTDVSFDESGKANIAGYINNVHPKHHAPLYPILAQAVEKAIPLWNECLDLSEVKERQRIKINMCGYEDFERPEEISEDDWPDKEWIENNEDDPDTLKLIQPTVTSDYVPILERRDSDVEPLTLLREFPDDLQVIFKLANIHLTPEKPSYEGSNWHVEGALNEHICATALFYYDQENVEESYLEFRQQLDAQGMMEIPDQYEYSAAERLFGVTQDGPAITNLGRVLTRSHRSLAFPNVLQHRVPPFSLRDPNKPGHRKILALFLVDPNMRLLSTSNVPPQRRDWWAEEVRKIGPFARLPEELFDMIVERVEDWPIGWDEACAVRERLMEERGGMSEGIREKWNQETFFFCEH